MVALGWILVLAAVGTIVVWIGADHLEESADRLAAYYGVPAIVQGAVLAGVGSSMPELVTAVLAPLLHGDFELGLAVIIGSAIFNVLIIPAVATLASNGPLAASQRVVYKEAQFYLIAVAVFLLTLSFAVIYEPREEVALGGEITPVLALLPLGLYVLYAFIQFQDTIEHVSRRDRSGIRPWREWARFVGGFLLILVGVEALLRSAIALGTALQTPSFIWGLTIIAAATSLPDTFVAVRAAQGDRSVTSIATVFGSNVFDLLVAVPMGVLVAGGAVIDFAATAPLMGALVFATIVLFAELRTSFELSRLEAVSLTGCYVLFLGWVLLDAFG